MSYTTDGPVRGSCGHVHLSERSARRCINRDHYGCAQNGGYSDRSVIDTKTRNVVPDRGLDSDEDR